LSNPSSAGAPPVAEAAPPSGGAPAGAKVEPTDDGAPAGAKVEPTDDGAPAGAEVALPGDGDQGQLITCIYCKQMRPPSREHVLARSLGGDATRLITCKPCNTIVLSMLDQAIAERSLVALSRLGETPADAFDVHLGGEHFHYDAARDIYAEVNMVNDMRAVLFPQLHYKFEVKQFGAFANNHDDIKSLVAFVDKRIANGTLRSIHVKQGPADRCTTARIVMHRSKDGFIRVREAGDEQRLYEALGNAWPTLRAQMLDGQFTAESDPTPTIEVHMSLRLDDTFRAVAKTAFNVLAMELGAPFALTHEFDELREYVLGNNLHHPTHLEPGQVAVDGRFVSMVPFDEPPLVPTEEHAVTLSYQGGQMLAYVTLYKRHSFVVALGTIALPEVVLTTHEFSAVRHGNRALDVAEVYERLTRRKRGA
jgi:HNH endonuclease